MSFNYDGLWKILSESKITKTELAKSVGFTSATLAKLGKNRNVNMDVLDKLCQYLKCDISDILSHDADINIKVVSLFSGIGGFEVALERSNLPASTIFASEIDNQATRSYKRNFPNIEIFGDITKISEDFIPNHDILVGGFPCQSFSIAGSRNGFHDTRGTLFFDIARILKHRTPKFILLENVKNLISHDNSRTIKIILKTLNELGYVIDFTVINSKEAGLPQSRDRTYIIGILDGHQDKFEIDSRNKKVNHIKLELNNDNFRSFNFFNSVKYTNKISTLKDIIESDVDYKYYFKSESITEYIKTSSIVDKHQVSNSINKVLDLPREIHNDNERQRRVYSVNGISPTILARSDSTKIFINNCVRKITPEEALRAQGFSDNFIFNIRQSGISDTQLYKQAGNAVSPPVVEGIFNELNEIILGGK